MLQQRRAVLIGIAFPLAELWIGILVIGLLIWLRPRLRNRLHVLAERVADPAASSFGLTLKAMLVIALLGMPAVIGYTAWVYWMFKGKVDVSQESAHY